MMRSHVRAAVMSVLCALIGSSAASETPASGFPIAIDGRPAATIVTAGDYEEPFDEGIRRPETTDLLRVIGKMSGASLPAVRDGRVHTTGPQIHLGMTDYVRSLNVVPDSLPVNGFRMLTTTENGQPRLIIAARSPLGMSHGIYSLLTDELGVIWGMPGALWEEVPQCNTIVLRDLDVVGIPDFGVRLIGRCRGSDWERRHRADIGGAELPYTQRGHAIFNVLPPSRYGDHPEYYAFHRGQYRVPESDSDHRFHVNPTQPGVIQAAVDYCREYFRTYPNSMGVSLCPSDDDTFDESPGSAALDVGLPVWRYHRQYGDSYGYFINAVAESLLITHPDKYISTFAYWNTEYPPRRIDHFPPNVVVYLTQDVANHFDPVYRADDNMILDMWRRKCDHVCVYEYHGLGWYTPRAFPTIIAERIRHLKELGTPAYYTEMHTNLAHSGPTDYITMRLLWDTETDVSGELDRWYAAMFHEVAPVMKEYYELLESTYSDTTIHRGHWFLGYYGLWEQIRSWPAGPRHRAMALLDSALAASRTDLTRARVTYIRNAYLTGHYICEAHEAACRLDPESPTLEEDVRHVTHLASRAIDALHQYLEADDEQSGAYYRGWRACERWKWLKYEIADRVRVATAGHPGMMERLANEDPLLGEFQNILTNVRMFGFMSYYRKLVRQRGMIPTYVPDPNAP